MVFVAPISPVWWQWFKYIINPFRAVPYMYVCLCVCVYTHTHVFVLCKPSDRLLFMLKPCAHIFVLSDVHV